MRRVVRLRGNSLNVGNFEVIVANIFNSLRELDKNARGNGAVVFVIFFLSENESDKQTAK